MKRRAIVRNAQAGFTLVEMIVSLAIGSLLMVALTSVVLTAWRASSIASSRVEASGQIQNFEFFAFKDFAQSSPPSSVSCLPASPCSQPLVLAGLQVSNQNPVPSPVQVTYSWDGSNLLDRSVAPGGTRHAATNVTAFSWYVDTDSTVVVSLTVTVQSYSESQTFRFLPRMKP